MVSGCVEVAEDLLRVAPGVLDCLVAHALASWPHECCGLLIGRRQPGLRVVAARPQRNDHPQSLEHYALDPLDWLRCARTLSGEQGIVGVYHSHPNRSAQASVYDQQMAEPGLVYVILGVGPPRSNKPGPPPHFEVRAWSWDASQTLREHVLLFEDAASLEEGPGDLHPPR